MTGETHLWAADTPPSFNKVGFTGSRWTLTKAVDDWKELLFALLLASDMPKGCEFVYAHATLTFPRRNGRDEENYRVILSKALGDVLAPNDRQAPHRWLPNDTADFFAFGVELNEGGGPNRTDIVLRWRKG